MPKKYTLDEVKDKNSLVNPNIEIIDTIYIDNKTPLLCRCKIDNHEWEINWNNLSNNHGCPKCYENARLKKLEEIKKEVQLVGCEVLEFININLPRTNKNFKMIIRCDKGHIEKRSWISFSEHTYCLTCHNIELRKQTILNSKNKAMDFVESKECKIIGGLDIYENNKSILTYKCNNHNHIWTDKFSNFINNNGCPTCNNILIKYNYKDVCKYFLCYGCIVLTPIDKYKNSKSVIFYQCKCGKIDTVTFEEFKKHKKCKSCRGCQVKYSYKELDGIFKSLNMILITRQFEYKKTDMIKYICSCGRYYIKVLTGFLNKSPICKRCSFEQISGENHRCWNSEKSEEDRLDDRKYLEYTNWRNGIYKRDNYICQACGDNKGGNLNAHHKDGYTWCLERRLDLSNGVTLCDKCHSLDEDGFHKTYGFYNNTEKQFNEWINNYRKLQIL